ncbi:hypothetical protein AYK24_01355 [Thermoplasmatales archaeon SG8-52-4]|nr:MAG: hypothetical protein AYK24_01355 [Thermoplasmatales archaeon SG8-52-4]
METSNDYIISVIVPFHKSSIFLNDIRKTINSASTAVEAIYVIDEKLNDFIKKPNQNEHIVVVKNISRGQTLAEGLKKASGEIVVFLHSDTILPSGWDLIIRNVMKDKRIIGGGFSLQFDKKHFFLKILTLLSNLLFYFSKELWGDRAIFVRTKPLKNNISILSAPIMEDVRLSSWMKKNGNVVLLKSKVTTSSETFFKYGLIRNTIRIIKVRLWYLVGHDLQRIFDYYYKKK